MKNTLPWVEPLHCPEGAGATLHPLQIVDHRIGDEARAVSARELHRALDIRRDFTSWLKSQVRRAGFVEGADFVLLTDQGERTGRGGHNRVDYLLTLNAAQHIALMSGTPAGRAYRAHLIRCERELIRLGAGAAQDLARLMMRLDQLNARGSSAGRDLGTLRRNRAAIERAAAPLRALVQPLLPGLEVLP